MQIVQYSCAIYLVVQLFANNIHRSLTDSSVLIGGRHLFARALTVAILSGIY